jgi:hypothetical protein
MSECSLEELAIDVLGGEVPLVAVLEEVEHLEPRRGDLEAVPLSSRRLPMVGKSYSGWL